MGSCSSKPGEVGSMPQEGSGSAAPMDPAAIEAVRATSSSRKQPLASPERPVTPYDRRVVSHDASRPTPSSRSPLARAPFEGEGTSPPRRGARSSATHGAMASSSAARLAAMTHGDAWPPPLEGERARDPLAQEGAETERRTSSPTRLGDASVVVYSLDGTVSTVRVPPAGASPGNASHAPSDRALQGLGSRLGAKKRALPLGRLPGSRPATGEREPHGDDARGPRRAGGRPATREGGRVTASEVMDAIAGTRQGGAVAAFTDPERSFTDPWLSNDAFRATASAPPAETEEAFPAPNAAQIAFGAENGWDPSSSDSDDEPAETLAMARERARHEERASAEKAKAEDTAREAGSGFRRDDAAGDGDATLEPPPTLVSRPESRILDFASDAPRLRMATLAPGPAPRPVSREAGRMPLPPPRLPRKEASPLKPPRPAPAETATAADVAADAAAEPRRETTPDLAEKNDVASRRKKKSPLEEELEAWGVSLPDSPTTRRAGGGDLVAVDDEDDDLLAAFGADADAAAEAPGATSGSLMSVRDSIPESPLVTSPLELSSSPLEASPLELVGETGTRAFSSETETTSTSPNRDFHSGSSADENAPEPRGAAADDARARETGGFADADDAESLAWLRKTMAFETPETPSSRGAKQGGGGDDDDAGVLRETRSASFLRGRENAVVAAIPDSGATRDARGAAAKKEDTRGVDGAARQDARGALSLLQTDSPSPGSASLSSSPRTRDSGGGDGGGASPRANALRAETVAAYGAGNATRSRTRRKSKIPPPPSPASVRSAANEVASAGVSISERAGENPRGPARKSARRPANPKSRLPPPPTSKTRDAEKAPDGVAAGAGAAAAAKATAAKPPASSRAVHGGASSSDASAAVPTAGTRLASTTAAGYSAGAAAGKGKAEKRLAKPMKPKPAASPAASPAARVASATSDARDAPRDFQRMTKKSASTIAEPEATEAPAPSATPAKLKKDHLASVPPAMTKAEEARARLRGSRQRRSIAGTASSVASSAGASSAAAAPTAAPTAAPRSPPKPAERGSDAATAAAAAAAASKLASKLGSVSVIKPRGERMSSKEGAAEKAEKAEKRAADAARRAEHAAAFAKAAAEAEAAKAAAAKAAKEEAAREAEIRVAGVDEAEMVLRVGSLCDEKTLVGARQAVHRMRALLDDVARLSRELKCEPQHVYGHVLHRLGFPVDRESRETPLERAVGAERAREMCAGVSELRNLLRIKVQDNNDLRLARTALCETADFFQRLDAFAAKKNKTPSEVLAAQAGGGYA